MATTIDWCEENWVVTPLVAEFYNTLTSVACIAPPLVWYMLPAPKQYRTLSLAHPLLALIMLGSAAFHGTMTWAGQLLDELPIILFCGFSFAILVDMRSLLPSPPGGDTRRATWAPGPWRLAAAVATELALVTVAYTRHHKMYSTFIGVVLLQALAHWPLILYEFHARLGWDRTAVQLLAQHVALGYTGYGLWCLENAFCERLRWLNLHAVWHVLVTFSLKPYVDLLIYCRARALGDETLRYRRRWAGFGPCLVVAGEAHAD